MTRQHVTKWVMLYKDGRTDTHKKERSRRLSVISDEVLQRVEKKFHIDRHNIMISLHIMTHGTLRESNSHISTG